MKQSEVYEVIEKLFSHIKSENYKGYDPYDALNSFIPYRIFGHKAQVLAIQLQLRNPVNLRPILGIKKEYSIKSLGIILHALSQLYLLKKDDSIRREMDYLFNLLSDKRIKNKEFSGSYWAVHYPIAWQTWERPRFDPSAVLACVVFEGIFEYYLATQSLPAKEILIDIGKFLKENIPVTETEYGKCYSYTARKKEIVYNANTYVAEVYSKLYYLTGTDFYRSEAIQCIDFTLHHQRNDGSWGYRLYPDGTEREQIDFHQGFIVNSLAEAIKYLRLDITNYTTALKKAYTFYMSKQFTESGKGLWRYPHMYPIDIHNQAVGVWIGSKYNSFAENENLKTKCDTILCWTMENMYNKRKGIFYYQKRRLFTNRIDYIRWNQAWMLLALVNNYKLHFDD